MREWTDRLPEEKHGLVKICASEVAIEQVEWIWPGRLAVGKHTCIAGEPGAGKSQLTMFIAAVVSTATAWPCGEGKAKQGSVIILSAEDAAADTIVPRLHASGADLGRIHIVSAVRDSDGRRSFSLQRDLALLEEAVRSIGDVSLIIIDPVSSYLGGKTDSHKNAEVRGVLEPLGEFAERMRVAVLSVTHFSKAGAGTTTKALHRFIGSIAFVGAPRIALAVIEDAPNDRRLLLHAKNNLALPPQGLAYRVKEKIVGESGNAVTAPHAVFDADPVIMTANEAMAADAGGADTSAGSEAEEFLRDLLANGPVPSKQIKADADGSGISWATVRRAKNRLGLVVKREGFGPGSTLQWALPSSIDAQSSHRCSPFKVSTYDENEHLYGRRGPNPHEEAQQYNWAPSESGEPLRANDELEPGSTEPEDEMPDLPAFLDRRASA